MAYLKKIRNAKFQLQPLELCGLYAKGFRKIINNKLSDEGEEMEEIPMPLTNIEIKGSIINRFAKLEIIHYYFNPTDKYLDTAYKFPRSLMQSFDGLKVSFDDKNIEGIIAEREKVEKIYKEEVEKGNTVIKTVPISTTDSFTFFDVLETSIGNNLQKRKLKLALVIFNY